MSNVEKELLETKALLDKANELLKPYCCERRMENKCNGYKCSERYDDSGNYACPFDEEAEKFLEALNTSQVDNKGDKQ